VRGSESDDDDDEKEEEVERNPPIPYPTHPSEPATACMLYRELE
jgi:hypothetical protein